MKSTTTDRQMEANRANCRKSTGPRTPEGRAVAKLNATKHGIFARSVVVCGENIRESEEEFISLVEEFRAELKPEGVMERMLVDQIVALHWRMRRALAAEAGEIARSVDEQEWELEGFGWQRLCLKWAESGDHLLGMKGSAMGLRAIRKWLGAVREALITAGELTEAVVEAFKEQFAQQNNELTEMLAKLQTEGERRLGEVKGEEETKALRAELLAEALEYVDMELGKITDRLPLYELRERQAQVTRQAAAVLPPQQVVTRILGYETKLSRELHRTMAQLERLQRQRQGEKVPPPMCVV